jgi:hypothetical protein
MAKEKKADQKRPVGRPKSIESPEQFWHLFLQYRLWAKDNPRIENIFSQKEAATFPIERERPLTWEDFDTWLLDNDIIQDTEHYRANRDGAYEDFIGVITRVRKAMYADKFTGAAVGIYNANIIARDLGLAEKKVVDQVNREAEPESLEEIEKRLADLRAKTGGN